MNLRLSSSTAYTLPIWLALVSLSLGLGLRAQPPAERPRPETRRDNYYDLRAKHLARMERAERERARRQSGQVRAEDQFELEFTRWDRYWLDHLDASAHEPGKMADMARHMRNYFLAAQRASKGILNPQTTALVCPATGLGNWTSLGPSTYPAPIMGKVTSVYVDPNNPNMAYAGSALGGLFKTVNNGASWTNLTDASHFPAPGITSIAVHPTTPTTIYIGTNNGGPGYNTALGGPYGFGILKTTNGGATWQESLVLANYMNMDEGAFVSKVVLHPQDPDTIYALALHTVLRSTDAGATWQKTLDITPGPNNDGCRYTLVDIDIINGASGVADSKVLVSTQRDGWQGGMSPPCGTARAFISTTGGALNGGSSSFNEITNTVLGGDATDRIAATVQPGNSAEFYVAYQRLTDDFGNGPLVVKKYNIAGQTATQVTVVLDNGVFQLGAGYWDLECQFSQLNANMLYVGGTTLYRVDTTSLLGGYQTSAYWATDPGSCAPLAHTHADIRAMTVSHSGSNDVVILGTDGGIHKALLDPAGTTLYTPTTANWHDMTGPGLALNEFFDINGMQSKPDLLVGGTLDNGTLEYNQGSWTQRFNYDGWQGTIAQGSGQYFGMTNADHPIYGPTGVAGTFNLANLDPSAGPLGPVVSDPNNPDLVYSGNATLYKSPYAGLFGTPLFSLTGSGRIRAIQVAPSNSQIVYVSRGGTTWNPNNLSDVLFRSNDGGNSWTDIGQSLPPLETTAVVDIAVDPDDAQRVWVGFNGYRAAAGNSLGGVNRVYYSADGGGHWTDFTYNLLAFPVSCLIYERGSDDVLYAGTDVGVFRYNKSLHAWECFNNLLPVVPVTRLEINYCKHKLRAATFGRGIYESDLPALASETVNTSVTWSGVRYLSNDLTVMPGATLTLTGTLYMSRDRRIIVRRGATLNVNGGTITNACGDMWYGVEVWGTSGAAQNISSAQGKVSMQNGAKIENAIAAITTGKNVNTSVDLNFTGGIVQTSDSFFYNNQRAVQLLPYHWLNAGIELKNLSSFKHCTFETNRRLNDATLLPAAHVSLNDVKNVPLVGCQFNNTAPLAVFGVNNRGDGVVGVNAEVLVDDLANNVISPPLVIAPSVFNGLTYGVRADFPAGVNRRVAIANSDFNNVQRGVEVNNSIGSAVTANNFNALPNALTTNIADATWGVRLSHAANLSVVGNTVTGANAAYQNNFGVMIDTCGSFASNLVRGNTLKNLYTGIFVRGNNGAGASASGVQFKCNVFQPAMYYQLAIVGGTLANQGSACVPGRTVDNTFFLQASPAGSQIYAPNVPVFSYYASGTVPNNISGPVFVVNCSNVVGACNTGLSQ